ncbi:SDR family oxidoreductase [Flavobacterium sp. ASW18X]|uniref:SDR family oxidoreductase n=1 Tax=Flavobacterium sp. ASW18X TaxID=2572595 RepID=UPI0010AE309B|nr:SDR family oxidoreductase [Flavobacterium sp. ASW18X]TKD67237.1 SDR family oxidoreductase [Flavobacterium sp. ASW18X]
MNLENKVIVITGASSGIGAATAKRLAKAGAKIVLTARREEQLQDLQEEIKANDGEALVVVADVTNKDDMRQVAAKAKSTFGTINGIINNAGVMPLSYIDKLKTEEWDQMVSVNINGVLNGVAAVLPTLMENKGGHIINISSSAAHSYFPGGGVYCATKAAIKMYSEGLRKELAPKYGINVTSIEPGFTSTELTDTITDDDILDMMKDMQEMTPLQAEDIAEAIYYAMAQPQRANVNDVYVMPTEQH